MKTLRFFGMALLVMILCVNFAACSDDDEEPQSTSDLIGTVWRGTNPHTDYVVEVEIKNDSRCVITTYEPDGSTVYAQEECSYVYDEATGEFVCQYDGYETTGKITGNTMTLTDIYGTYTLKRQ